VLAPEAAMNLNNRVVFCQCHIRFSQQVFSVQAKAMAKARRFATGL
jgi:hypothetical protein